MKIGELPDKLSELSILTVGDIMLDKYVIGDVKRISPEAPVPVVEVIKEFHTLGGCGNVAKNISTLGTKSYCVSSCGSDLEGDIIHNLLERQKIRGRMATRNPTTVKERIIANHRQIQMLRIDRENTEDILASKIITEINFLLKVDNLKPDIIIVSDYNKGVITRELMTFLENLPAKLIIDPKPQHQYRYKKCYAITPNENEYRNMSIWENEGFKNLIITCGKDGVFIPRSDVGTFEIPGNEVEVYNVTGAGDSFVSIFSICIGIGLDVLQSSKVANTCAAYVVTKPGTSCVPYDVFQYAVELVLK
jgi:rfaE bifunctional protein kinase chain/domain